MLLLLLGDTHHAPSPTAGPDVNTVVEAAPSSPEADACTALLDKGIAQYNADKVEAAATTWAQGYRQCGAGHGFLAQQALTAAKLQHYDDAAHLVLRELSEPDPTALALKLLIALKLQVSSDVTAAVYARGRTPETAIVVPDVHAEYAWLRFLLCGGKEQALRQALVQGPNGPLDKLEFVCPGGAPQVLYFDYSADPAEKALLDALEAEGGAATGTP